MKEEKEIVLITGANSFIARHLHPILEENYVVKFLTRSPTQENEYRWDIARDLLDENALDDVQYIVHLSGSKFNDGTPFTEERMNTVYQSRIGAANLLRKKLKERGQKLKSFISASAIGYYAFNDNLLEIDERGNKGTGFGADLSEDWEKAADLFKSEDVAEHVAKIRVPIVMGNDGGIFPVFKDKIAAKPDRADQEVLSSYPWNHVDDMAGIFAHALTHQLHGVYNAVAPEPITLQDVFKAIANQLAGTDYKIEPFEGQRLIAKKIMDSGYSFKYPTIQSAVQDLIPG